jgi:3-deoxy-D-manno-octulosonic-acid transferase
MRLYGGRFMLFLYNFSIALYGLALRLAAPLNQKARLLVAGRQNWREPLSAKPLDSARPVAWFHAASLGEFEQGRPVIEAFRAAYPDWQVVLSFFSPSGYEVRKTYAGADVVTYLPTDTAANACDWLAEVRPQLAFFIKYEFWYHYLHALHKANVPTVSFSAIFRPNQLFFRSYGMRAASRFYRNILTYLSAILVQNDESVALLGSIGIEATLAGDTRFDRVAQVAANRRAIPEVAAFVGNVPTLVVGSAWAADMAVLIPFLNGFGQPLNVVIAPHEIDNEEIERWRRQLSGTSVRFSELEKSVPGPARYLFIDNIGMLSSLYQYGAVAYIGGAFGKGLHNCLEAATFGLPLLFGIKYRKFQEASDLVAQGGAFQVRDTHELTAAFTRLYADAAARQRAGAVCQAYVQANTGATARVMAVVNRLLNATPPD